MEWFSGSFMAGIENTYSCAHNKKKEKKLSKVKINTSSRIHHIIEVEASVLWEMKKQKNKENDKLPKIKTARATG